MMRSDSLSLSSYSSWLLPAVLKVRGGPTYGEDTLLLKRRRRRAFACTRRPVVTTSSVAAEDSEDEEGCDDTSIQDSV